MHKIYALFDPADPNCAVRYVGYTSNSLETRLKSHLSDVTPSALKGHPPSSHRQKWLMKLRREGRKPGIVLIEEFESGDWQERERFWIAKFREFANLTNGTDGGEGLIGASPELRKLIAMKGSETRKRNGTPSSCKGVPLTAEHREAISQGMRNSEKFKEVMKKRSENPKYREAMLPNLQKAYDAIRGKPFTEEHRAKLRASNLARYAAGAKTAAKGTRWCNDGKNNLQLKVGEGLPQGFRYGRLMSRAATEAASLVNRGTKRPKEFGDRIRNAAIGRFLITDGQTRKWCRRDAPIPEGWERFYPSRA